MPHNHAHGGHDHGHSHAPPGNNAAFAVGVSLNLAFVVAELIYGLAANSLALLSDAGHNLSDVFGLLIAWGAIHLGKSLPSKRRTYGLRRSSILAALTNAMVLLVVVGGITWEAVGRFFHPGIVAGNTVIWVAAAGVVINTATALLFMAGREHLTIGLACDRSAAARIHGNNGPPPGSWFRPATGTIMGVSFLGRHEVISIPRYLHRVSRWVKATAGTKSCF